jgi:hypothetical protein
MVAHQLQVGLVDQGGRLQRLAWGQPGTQRPREVAQLGVERREQLGGRPQLGRGLARLFVRHRWVTSGAKGVGKRPQPACGKKCPGVASSRSDFRIV